MLYVVLAVYAAALGVWGYWRIGALNRRLRENQRKTHPNRDSESDGPSWYRADGDENWPDQTDTSWPKK